MEVQKKSFTTRITSEQAKKLVEETTKRELENLNKIIQSNPELLKRNNSLEILEDEIDELDDKSNDSDLSDSTVSSSLSDSSKSAKKKKSKSNKTKTKSKSNKIQSTDLISRKDLSIDKLENENRYLKLDLSNSNIKNIELSSKNSKFEKKMSEHEKLNEFYFQSVKFLETNYLDKINIQPNKQITIIPLRNLTSSKRINELIQRFEQFFLSLNEKINFISMADMKKILDESTIVKNEVISDHENIKKIILPIFKDDDNSVKLNCVSNYFYRRINYKKDNVVKEINKIIGYYEYLYKIEETAFKLLVLIIGIYFIFTSCKTIIGYII